MFCDNSTAVAYVNNMGGKIMSLNCIAFSIWELCLSFDCSIEAFHVPGVENVCADRLSRKHESSLEWKLHPTVFKWIAERYFAPDIDLFASRLNYQVRRYVSWKPDPGAGGGRVFGSLVLFETLFVSSFQPTGQSVAETESGRSSKRG